MGEMKISGPVAIVAIVVVLVILVMVGNRLSSPPQKLGPVAQSMMDNIHRGQAQSGQPAGSSR
jgi:hypothetical protein